MIVYINIFFFLLQLTPEIPERTDEVFEHILFFLEKAKNLFFWLNSLFMGKERWFISFSEEKSLYKLFKLLSWLHNESNKVFEIIMFELKKLFSLFWLFSSLSENKIFRGSCFSSFKRRNLESLFCRTGINLSPYIFHLKYYNAPLKLYIFTYN